MLANNAPRLASTMPGQCGSGAASYGGWSKINEEKEGFMSMISG